ncbi:MAG: hypothetical protein QM691_10100 [Opitutaceae bacterium]
MLEFCRKPRRQVKANKILVDLENMQKLPLDRIGEGSGVLSKQTTSSLALSNGRSAHGERNRSIVAGLLPKSNNLIGNN